MKNKNIKVLKTVSEWIDVMKEFMSGMEQACYQSMKHKICINCFSQKDLILQNKRVLIKSTDYYLCKECVDHYNNKQKEDE